LVIRVIERRLAAENVTWRQQTWMPRVLEWERTRAWGRMTLRHSGASLPSYGSPTLAPVRLGSTGAASP